MPDSALTAAAMTAILDGGGDMPPAGPLCNSGPRAVYGRGVGGPRMLQAQDQVVLELAATRNRYNVCIERTFILGEMPAAQRRMADTVRDAMAAMVEAARPGNPAGAIAEAFGAVVDARRATPATASPPAATRWAPPSGRAGWTCRRCCTPATR
jgi:Xaa-Pro dipeptidase